MKFEGNLTSFFPPDLLSFAAFMGKEGILTITDETITLSITLKENCIIDAQSQRADHKILKSLLSYGLLNSKNYQYLLQARDETKMPVRQILERLNLFTHKRVQSIYKNCIKEVFFQFFNLKTGFFKFMELDIGDTNHLLAIDPQSLIAEISQWIDEYKEMENELSIHYKRAVLISKSEACTKNETILIKALKEADSLDQLIKHSPLPSHGTLKLVKKLVDTKILQLDEIGKTRVVTPELSRQELLFSEFKNAGRRILTSKNLNEKIKGLLGYCQAFFDHFFIISMNRQTIKQISHFYRDSNNALKKARRNSIKIDQLNEPVLLNILETGATFFGSYFETHLFKEVDAIEAKKLCAVIPYKKTRGFIHFLYVLSAQTSDDDLLYKYLEILSWMVNPETGFKKAALPGSFNDSKEDTPGLPDNDPAQRLKTLTETVNELPPISPVTNKVLNLLSDPNYELDTLVQLLSLDPAIMAAILKVSNSVLFRTTEEITTIGEAVKRLGPRAVKGILIAAATQILFPKGRSQFYRLSHPLWTHSTRCGIIAKRIALFIRYPDPDEAYVGGILHDIGKLAILMKDIEAFKKIRGLEEKAMISSVESEHKILGFTHTEVGELLMKQWKMPTELSQCVQYHHSNPDGESPLILTDIIALANFYSHHLKSGSDLLLINRPGPIAIRLKKAGLSEEDEIRLFDEIRADLEQSDHSDG